MTRAIILCILSTLSFFTHAAETYVPPLPTLEVATVKLDWHDAKRDRDVPAEIYFSKDGAGPFPVVIFSHSLGGSHEILPQTTATDRRIPFDHMSRAETCLVIFNEGDHFVFFDRERMAATPGQLAQDAVFQKLICTSTTGFWEAYLKGNPAAKKWLLEGGCEELLGAQATFEKKLPAQQSKGIPAITTHAFPVRISHHL